MNPPTSLARRMKGYFGVKGKQISREARKVLAHTLSTTDCKTCLLVWTCQDLTGTGGEEGKDFHGDGFRINGVLEMEFSRVSSIKAYIDIVDRKGYTAQVCYQGTLSKPGYQVIFSFCISSLIPLST